MFQTREIGSEEFQKEVLAFLETELAVDMETTGTIMAEKERSGNYTQWEIFDLGRTFGQKREKEIHTAPEKFNIARDYADLLRQAIQEYQKESYIQVNSIFITDINEHNSEVEVRPTQAVHLFNVASRYGKLVLKQEHDEQLKQSFSSLQNMGNENKAGNTKDA
jgi:GTP-sensing pleiotropic transcriptional regulator CodY